MAGREAGLPHQLRADYSTLQKIVLDDMLNTSPIGAQAC